MTAAKNRFTIDDNGQLEASAQALAQLKNQEFEIQENGHIIPIGPRPRKLHEIQDVDERMAAYEAFKKRVMRPAEQPLPSDWETIRDSIYD